MESTSWPPGWKSGAQTILLTYRPVWKLIIVSENSLRKTILLNNPGGYLTHRPGLSGIIGGGSSGTLSSISVTSSGSKYISAPTVVFSNANRIREAVATGLIVTTGAYSGLVTGIHIADKGLGYESTPSIAFTGSLYGGGYNATGTATMKEKRFINLFKTCFNKHFEIF